LRKIRAVPGVGSRAARILGAARWTNAFLQPPDDAWMELMGAMSHDRRLAQEYYDNFNRPERQWERICSAERIRAWMAEEATHAAQPMTVTANS
jgi:hypothetical protein